VKISNTFRSPTTLFATNDLRWWGWKGEAENHLLKKGDQKERENVIKVKHLKCKNSQLPSVITREIQKQ